MTSWLTSSALLARRADWPDGIDSFALVLFFALVFLLPLLGYWFMVVDIRTYLRAMRGMLVVVHRRLRGTPHWARSETPGCLRSLGLELPCTEDEIKHAYRRLAADAPRDG